MLLIACDFDRHTIATFRFQSILIACEKYSMHLQISWLIRHHLWSLIHMSSDNFSAIRFLTFFGNKLHYS